MDLGLWETLGEWLSRLPNRVLKVRPWLVYHQGEIAAAQHLFSTATTLFTARHEPEGACQSMLAEIARTVGEPDAKPGQLGEATGTLAAGGHVELRSTGLPPGIYRLDGAVRVAQPGSDLPHRVVAVQGRLLQVNEREEGTGRGPENHIAVRPAPAHDALRRDLEHLWRKAWPQLGAPGVQDLRPRRTPDDRWSRSSTDGFSAQAEGATGISGGRSCAPPATRRGGSGARRSARTPAGSLRTMPATAARRR
jgi:hypothetical protein